MARLLAATLLLLCCALPGCQAPQEAEWPTGLPQTLRMPDGGQSGFEWAEMTILNPAGEPATVYVRTGARPDQRMEGAWMLDAADLSVVAFGGPDGFVRFDPHGPLFLPASLPAVAYEILQARLPQGTHHLDLAGADLKVTVGRDVITYIEDRPTRLRLDGSKVHVATGGKDHSTGQTGWEHKYTLFDFRPIEPAASKFESVQGLDAAPFQHFPPMSAYGFPLEAALERGAQQDEALRSLMSEPDWYVAFATNGVVPEFGVLGYVLESVQWHVTLASREVGLYAVLEAPLVNGQAVLDAQETRVSTEDIGFFDAPRDQIVSAEEVQQSCLRFLRQATVSYLDQSESLFMPEGWTPAYTCGPNFAETSIVLDARTGLIQRYDLGVYELGFQ